MLNEFETNKKKRSIFFLLHTFNLWNSLLLGSLNARIFNGLEKLPQKHMEEMFVISYQKNTIEANSRSDCS